MRLLSLSEASIQPRTDRRKFVGRPASFAATTRRDRGAGVPRLPPRALLHRRRARARRGGGGAAFDGGGLRRRYAVLQRSPACYVVTPRHLLWSGNPTSSSCPDLSTSIFVSEGILVTRCYAKQYEVVLRCTSPCSVCTEDFFQLKMLRISSH